ncbi:hypothetical protein EH223_13030 [candidate division KSB1 bacterium]|nr:hypothetical protein [candidate division KSB1 bacterium]RQW02205.1 MAG: hypothetical protein EH223_13030 [candidate division KSB1 bacterium]
MQFLIIFAIFTLVMLGFIFSLKFSRYKQTPERRGCCGGGHCGVNVDEHSEHIHSVSDDHVCCKEIEAEA